MSRESSGTLQYTSVGRKVFNIANALFLFLVSMAVLIPLLIVIVTSLSPDSVVAREGYVLIPQGITFENYTKIFKSGYMSAFRNSIIVTISSTLVSMVLTVVMGYAMAQKDLIGKKFLIRFVVATMVLDAGIIPFYLVVKNLGMIDSYLSLIIPTAISTYNLILMKNYMSSIPTSLIEAARIDGCSELGILFRIVIPVSIPIIAAVTLFYTVSHWNNYLHVVMFINDSSKYTLQVLLRQLIFQSESAISSASALNNFKMAVMVMTMIPVLILYPFIQRYFISGIMLGSIKE
ncbi:carbohydrate ABC transporter permease [Acetivibrio mesophilus]|nr:carbohydrate ABC transporter permease [Acetivibrio mesophilus]ODM25336.1 ABC transporter permease [Clostridium sp. Bc-iso-3]